jgi:hypothetical protein
VLGATIHPAKNRDFRLASGQTRPGTDIARTKRNLAVSQKGHAVDGDFAPLKIHFSTPRVADR